jgi:hypothetical protein
MTRAILRWLIPLAALLALAPLAAWMTVSLRAPDGGPETSLLLCNSPARGILAGLGAFALATLAGAVASRLLGVSWGFFAAGLVLAGAAWGTGRVDQIVRRTQSASTLWALSAEGFLVGALGVLTAVVVVRARAPSERSPHVTPSDDDRSALAASLALGLPIMVLAGAVGAWIVAREPLKGQTFAAAAVAGILIAIAGHLVAPRAPLEVFVLAVAVLAAASPALSLVVNLVPTATGAGATVAFLPGSSRVLAAVRAGTMLPLARPLPLDWISGAFVGIPIGLAWAGAMVEKHDATDGEAGG